ncbi:hypothetical protein MKQ68_10940 [Chitinophaga horti]|uniref:Uncharacterized protein n=1 Tax=Chitinophaga horti TaxID=2920382 RepID=A0ABY6JAM6_9BACT|nr:hypothetical protein [Chitinophaga horti]UYQ95617.1 hypothetical protein MKQ68_10940 [Chitinophaga horti]
MIVFLGFLTQLGGSYLLYSASARAVFARGRHHRYLQQHRQFARLTGGFLQALSLFLFMQNMGISVGLLFALASFMCVSGYMIILFPLFRK